MRPRCLPVQATLDARGEPGLTRPMHRHVERCARCTAALDDERELRRGFAELATTSMTAPSEILPRVMDGIGPWAVPDPEPRGHRVAIAAAALATAAAAAGTAVVVRFARHRPA